MGSEWREYRLDEISELIVDCPHSTPQWTDSGVIVLRNQYIRNGTLNLSAPSFTNEEGYEKRIKRATPRAGDIVLTREAPMGEVCLIPEGLRCCLGQRMVLIRINESIANPKFILFSFQAPYLQHQIDWNRGTGTTVSNIRMPNIKAFKIPLPELLLQNRIAHILGSLDDKITLLRKMNETLEQMAQALFQSWFVDFDPVIDKALEAGHDIPEPLQARAVRRQALGDQRKPLPPEIADLFPDAFTFHEDMGWVPEGWEVGKVKDIGENPRDSIQPNSILPETPYIGLQNMPQKSIALADWQTAEEISSNKYVFEKGDILFGKLRPYFHKVGIAPVSGICSTDILVVKPKQKYWLSLLLGHLSSDAFISYTANSSSGTRMPRTNWKDMGNYTIAIPATKLSDYLSTLFQNYISQIDSNIHQMLSLTSLRDTLLPKLISGELEVGEVIYSQ